MTDKPASNLWMRPYEEFERFFDRMLGRNWPKPFKWETPMWGDLMGSAEARMPSVDVLDHDDHLLVRAEIPGVNKEDLRVSISDNVLTSKATPNARIKRRPVTISVTKSRTRRLPAMSRCPSQSTRQRLTRR
jgi:HSP20 family molecular chaperone IbpA